jgi:hypothetical protein
MKTNDPNAATHTDPTDDRDPFLRVLAEAKHSGRTVSVLSGGAIVTGRLVAESEYAESLMEKMTASVSRQGDAVQETRTNIAELISQGRGGFIHLQDVQVRSPGDPRPQRLDGLWRVRLAAVDAFSIA